MLSSDTTVSFQSSNQNPDTHSPNTLWILKFAKYIMEPLPRVMSAFIERTNA